MRNKVNFKENKKNPKKTKDAGVGGPPTPGWWTTDHPQTITAPKCAKFSENLEFFDNKCPIKPQNHKKAKKYFKNHKPNQLRP